MTFEGERALYARPNPEGDEPVTTGHYANMADVADLLHMPKPRSAGEIEADIKFQLRAPVNHLMADLAIQSGLPQ